MRILLTGANGQVAHDVKRSPESGGVQLITFDRQSLDISRRSAVDAAMDSSSPEVVINTAAYTAVDKAESEAEIAFAVNRDGASHLAAACAERKIPLIHISTDYVFDGSLDRPYREDDAVNPVSVYGRSKWEGEDAVRRSLDQHVIFRVSWVFGAHGHNFVRTMLRLGRDRDQLRIVADQRGGPTYASDIARLLLKAARHAVSASREGPTENQADCWGTFHFCGQPPICWKDFADAIFETAQNSGLIERRPTVTAITTADYPTPARRPLNSVLDCQKVQRVFRVPASDWRQGLSSMLAEWKLAEANR